MPRKCVPDIIGRYESILDMPLDQYPTVIRLLSIERLYCRVTFFIYFWNNENKVEEEQTPKLWKMEEATTRKRFIQLVF